MSLWHKIVDIDSEVTISSKVLRNPNLSISAIIFYATLKLFSKDTGFIYFSNKNLSKITNLSERSVRRHIKELEKERMIEIIFLDESLNVRKINIIGEDLI